MPLRGCSGCRYELVATETYAVFCESASPHIGYPVANFVFFCVAVGAGIEPAIGALTVRCLTAWLSHNMEPETGIGPVTFALQKRCSTN